MTEHEEMAGQIAARLAVPVPASDLPHIFRVWPVLRAGIHFPVNPLGNGEAIAAHLPELRTRCLSQR